MSPLVSLQRSVSLSLLTQESIESYCEVQLEAELSLSAWSQPALQSAVLAPLHGLSHSSLQLFDRSQK